MTTKRDVAGRLSRSGIDRTFKNVLLTITSLLVFISQPSWAFFANLVASPDPNTGDYTVTSDISGSVYKL